MVNYWDKYTEMHGQQKSQYDVYFFEEKWTTIAWRLKTPHSKDGYSRLLRKIGWYLSTNYMSYSRPISTSTVTSVRTVNLTKVSCLLVWSFCQSLVANAGRISQIRTWALSTNSFPSYCSWSSSLLIQVAVRPKAQSASTRLLGSQILSFIFVFVFSVCCAGSGLCDGLIPG